MFTGIIENTGKIEEVLSVGTNKTFWISSPLSNELKVDQSLSHNGVCLTVEEVKEGMHRVTAIAETLEKTDVGDWEKDKLINLERCMLINGRLDGHIVQGHVDTTAVCLASTEKDGSWEFQFEFDEKFKTLIIEKGSVCINGISLTAYNVTDNSFCVAIVPYTYYHTNIKNISVNSTINIEFDILGKYIARIMKS